MSSRYAPRVLETKPCVWCRVGIVRVTTATAKAQRATRRFCSRQCAGAAGGITHGQDWQRRISAASAKARKQKAHNEAVAMLRDLTPARAARRIYERGYQAGYFAGKKTGTELEHARLTREFVREQLGRVRAQARIPVEGGKDQERSHRQPDTSSLTAGSGA